MNVLGTMREVFHPEKVFDFWKPEVPPDLDLMHGIILYMEDISISFDGFKVIDNLNLYIKEGELRCLIGPNGAGKTTIMDIITGKTRPDAGKAWFGQRINLLQLSPPEIVNAGIGRKFQKPTVFENHTVFENLELAIPGDKGIKSTLFARLTGEQKDRIDSILDLICLKEEAYHLAGSLSHGQKQWLEIGMLVMQNPKLLLVDEPAAGMTGKEMERTAELLTSLAGERSVVVVEHDMDFIRSIAKTVTVLHQGHILAEGPMDQIQHDPKVIEVYLGD